MLRMLSEFLTEPVFARGLSVSILSLHLCCCNVCATVSRLGINDAVSVVIYAKKCVLVNSHYFPFLVIASYDPHLRFVSSVLPEHIRFW